MNPMIINYCWWLSRLSRSGWTSYRWCWVVLCRESAGMTPSCLCLFLIMFMFIFMFMQEWLPHDQWGRYELPGHPPSPPLWRPHRAAPLPLSQTLRPGTTFNQPWITPETVMGHFNIYGDVYVFYLHIY